MKLLVYAEKSSDWKEIAKGLSNDWNINLHNWKAELTSFEWDDVTVFWWAWHFYGLKNPKELWYDYSLINLPILPTTINFNEDKSFDNKKNLLINAKSLLKDTSFDKLVFAWDAWREWLAILDRLYKECNCTIEREYIWKWDSSKEEVRKLWKNRLKWTDKLISWEIIDGLTESANQRAIADWKIWMNFSQLYTLYYKLVKGDYLKFRIGRVITPTLNMVYIREQEIKSFEPKKYYKIGANFTEWFTANIRKWDLKEDYRFFSKEEVEAEYVKLVNEKEGIVESIQKKDNKIKPSFWLNGSNIKMSKELKITPKKVLDIISEMYNTDWVMSYPRVESKHITKAEASNIEKTITFLWKNKDKIPSKYEKILQYIIWNEFKTTIPVVNEKKIIEGHGAFHIKNTKWKISEQNIITFINRNDTKSKIFKKILHNNLGFYLPESVKTATNIKIKIGESIFTAEHSYTSRLGFKILNNESVETPSENLEKILEWDKLLIKKISIQENFTKPPKRISTDNIMAYMSDPKKLFEVKVDEKDLFDMIDKTEGIWQPATRQIIIENMITEDYVRIEKGDFYMTENWINILKTVHNKTKDVLVTAKLEQYLNEIAYSNSVDKIESINSNIDKYITEIIDYHVDEKTKAKYEEQGIKKRVLIEIKSPEGYNLYLKEDKKKKGEYYVTSDDNIWENNYPLFYSKYDPVTKKLINPNHICNTNVKCPSCSKKTNVFKSPKNNKLYIECIWRKNWDCKFVSAYDIDSDSIVKDDKEYLEHLCCPKCKSKVYVRKSQKNWNYYWICEKNNWKDWCDFIKEYDRKSKQFMLPIYMRNIKSTGLKINWEDIYENDKTFLTKDGKFTVWKNIGWVTIGIEILREVLSKKVTQDIIHWFVWKSWKEFSARLKLENGKIKYQF